MLKNVGYKILQQTCLNHQILALGTQPQAVEVLPLVGCSIAAEERYAFVRHTQLVEHDRIHISLQGCRQTHFAVGSLYLRDKQTQIPAGDIRIRQAQCERGGIDSHDLAVEL